jgi:hypothetical protein
MKEASDHSGWIKPKLVLPITSQLVTRMQVLLTIGVGSWINWEKHDNFTFTIVNNCLDNTVISHVQSKKTSKEAWRSLTYLFESKNVVTKMYLKDKF